MSIDKTHRKSNNSSSISDIFSVLKSKLDENIALFDINEDEVIPMAKELQQYHLQKHEIIKANNDINGSKAQLAGKELLTFNSFILSQEESFTLLDKNIDEIIHPFFQQQLKDIDLITKDIIKDIETLELCYIYIAKRHSARKIDSQIKMAHQMKLKKNSKEILKIAAPIVVVKQQQQQEEQVQKAVKNKEKEKQETSSETEKTNQITTTTTTTPPTTTTTSTITTTTTTKKKNASVAALSLEDFQELELEDY